MQVSLSKFNDHPFNTHDLLKIIAILAMTIDHLGYYHFEENEWLRIIGRLAAPLFFFVIGTSTSFRFKQDILLWGLIITFINIWVESDFLLNILISIVLIKLFLKEVNPCHFSTGGLIILFLIGVGLFPLISSLLEYGTMGLLFAVSGALIAKKQTRGFYFLLATTSAYFYFEGVSLDIFSTPSFVLGLMIVCSLLLFILAFFTVKTINVPKHFKKPLIALSHYSLIIYVVQVGLGDLGFWDYLTTF